MKQIHDFCMNDEHYWISAVDVTIVAVGINVVESSGNSMPLKVLYQTYRSNYIVTFNLFDTNNR